MNYWQALILAIVEGLTEYLPISSTAHLVLASEILKIAQSDFLKTFEIGIQSGAILAVVTLYLKKIWGKWERIKKLTVAVIPTGIIGLVGYKLVKEILIGNSWVTIIALFLGGIFILIWEKYLSKSHFEGKSIEELTYLNCIEVGIAQAVAIIPGVSRSAATIFGGMGAGLSRQEAVEMSFLLAVPTLAAATGWDLLKSYKEITLNEWGLLAWGALGAWIVGMAVVKWLVGYVRNNDMRLFGWYRMVLAVGWAIGLQVLHG